MPASLSAIVLFALSCNPASKIDASPITDNTPYNYAVAVNTSSIGETIPNVVSNMNVWDMGRMFHNPDTPGKISPFNNFVEYVQLMTATGGSADRDLLINPNDRTVLDDYNFKNLIENCRGILAVGARPHIKLGNVPGKFTTNYNTGGFGVNVYAPDDYQVYYNYLNAMVKALVAEFGLDEVKTWHFGVLTEYENKDWWWGLDGSAKSAKEEYFKLYDWSAKAVTDELGEDVYIGAHSMTCSEGLWDEAQFIKHCAEGTNYADPTRTGAPLSYLATSFYDNKPGQFGSWKNLYESISFLKGTAERYGLSGLKYGVDEGRMLASAKGSEKADLYSRIVGFTYMAANDARLYLQLIDAGGSYLSSWYYLSESIFEGNPSVSYHVANNIHNMAGMNRAEATVKLEKPVDGAEIKALAGVDPSTGRTIVMVYNFKNSLDYKDSADIRLEFHTSLEAGNHKVIVSRIDDDCNWFDEWVQDRKDNGVANTDFSWSPDDPCCVLQVLKKNQHVYKENFAKYKKCSALIPKKSTTRVDNSGNAIINVTLPPNTVAFVEIQ